MAFWLAAAPPSRPTSFPPWDPPPQPPLFLSGPRFTLMTFSHATRLPLCGLTLLNNHRWGLALAAHQAEGMPEERDRLPVTDTWPEIREIDTWATVTCRKDDRYTSAPALPLYFYSFFNFFFCRAHLVIFHWMQMVWQSSVCEAKQLDTAREMTWHEVFNEQASTMCYNRP